MPQNMAWPWSNYILLKAERDQAWVNRTSDLNLIHKKYDKNFTLN